MRTNHEVRYRAVVHYCHFLRSLRRVANLYGVSKSSLQRWVAARGDPPQRRRAAGHPKPIDQAVRNCIEQVLTERPFTTSKELVDVLRDRCGLRTSRSTANRLVRRAGFTYKKAFRAVLPVHDAATVQGFCDRFKASEKVVCVDEAGFYVGDHSRRGYAKKGGRLRIHKVLHCKRSVRDGPQDRCRATWNRDVNASKNILMLLMLEVLGMERPAAFCREPDGKRKRPVAASGDAVKPKRSRKQ
jgi:transposase